MAWTMVLARSRNEMARVAETSFRVMVKKRDVRVMGCEQEEARDEFQWLRSCFCFFSCSRVDSREGTI